VINALTRSRSPEFHRQTMFRLVILAAVGVLFWTSTPARTVTADALDSAAQFVRP
jgi:hypothetical protein